MPRKIRQLEADLKKAGFVAKPGKGSHRNYVHPKLDEIITVSGKEGDDAKHYQEKQIREAIEKVGR